MTRVLVTDGDERAALAVVRSLGRAGYEVHVASRSGRSLAGASRFAATDRAAGCPLRDPDGFSDAVLEIVKYVQPALVLPVTEAAQISLLTAQNLLGDAVLACPSAEAFDAIRDKGRILAAAREIGIAVPRQITLADPSEADVIGERLRFPVVLKPSRSVADAGGHRVKLSVRHAADRNAFLRQLRDVELEAFPLLVQERVDGTGAGVFVLVWGGELLAAFAHERLREKPPSGGVSVFRRSVAPDPVLLERSLSLLRRFDWQGVAMVEFKRERTTSVPYLMEVNGRFWGSLQLAIDAGVDFPRLLADAALHGRCEPVLGGRVGVLSRWTTGEVDHLIARLRGARASDHRSGILERARAVAEFLSAFRPGVREEVLRWSDPRPGLVEWVAWFGAVVSRSGSGRRPESGEWRRGVRAVPTAASAGTSALRWSDGHDR